MRIGELARRSGLSNDTLRYYEKQGLIAPPQRSASGYRDYSDDVLQHLQFISRAKSVGFSLKECQQLLSIFKERDAHTCAEVKDLAEAKLVEIQQQMHDLQQIHQTLQKISDACCGGNESAIHCSILGQLDTGNNGKSLL